MAQTTTHVQVIDAFGEPARFRTQDLSLSAPGRGQVQIKVAAVAVNPVDLQTRTGRVVPAAAASFPMVLGWDAAGTIEQIGDGVESWHVGDRVAAMSVQPVEQNGTYTEYLNLAADLVAPVPDDLSFEQAATILLAVLTASSLVR